MCLHGVLCSILLNSICNTTTFRFFLPLTPTQGSRVFVRTEYVLAYCCIHDSIDMQHDHVLKKLNFVCGQIICYHDAACVIPFNLICSMTIF